MPPRLCVNRFPCVLASYVMSYPHAGADSVPFPGGGWPAVYRYPAAGRDATFVVLPPIPVIPAPAGIQTRGPRASVANLGVHGFPPARERGGKNVNRMSFASGAPGVRSVSKVARTIRPAARVAAGWPARPCPAQPYGPDMKTARRTIARRAAFIRFEPSVAISFPTGGSPPHICRDDRPRSRSSAGRPRSASACRRARPPRCGRTHRAAHRRAE